MDEFGSYGMGKEGWDELAQNLKRSGTIVFPWSHNNFDGYIFFISINYQKLGVMPFGGNPAGRAYVGLWNQGCDHIRMDGLLQKYDLDKIGLDDDGAEKFCEMWNYICSNWLV